MTKKSLKVATFASGCFWCSEAIFSRVRGVERVVSGYSGGDSTKTSYEDVSSGMSGHAEAIQIYFDEDLVSYEDLLEIFWLSHNPTTLNRQGNDVGTQYRSVIFYHDADQLKKAQASKEKLDASKTWFEPIVTQIVKFENFFEAEDYHQQYYKNNQQAPYCQLVISPKLTKLLKDHKQFFNKEK